MRDILIYGYEKPDDRLRKCWLITASGACGGYDYLDRVFLMVVNKWNILIVSLRSSPCPGMTIKYPIQGVSKTRHRRSGTLQLQEISSSSCRDWWWGLPSLAHAVADLRLQGPSTDGKSLCPVKPRMPEQVAVDHHLLIAVQTRAVKV